MTVRPTLAVPRFDTAEIVARVFVVTDSAFTGTVIEVAPTGIVSDVEVSFNAVEDEDRVTDRPPTGAGDARRTVRLIVAPLVAVVDGKKSPIGRVTAKAVSVSVWLFNFAITAIGLGNAPTGSGQDTLAVVDPTGIVRVVGRAQPGTLELNSTEVGTVAGELSVALTMGSALTEYHFASRLTDTVWGWMMKLAC